MEEAVSQVGLRKKICIVYSGTDGASFMTMSKVVADQGAVLLTIRTRDGDVFGAFASSGFHAGPNFTGDDRTFLYTLAPRQSLHTASGYNTNFAYLNVHTRTMPNGMVWIVDSSPAQIVAQGVGGVLEPVPYFSLWLDSDFATGRSQARATTFSCPSLCSHGRDAFELDALEVWAVGEAPEVDVKDASQVWELF